MLIEFLKTSKARFSKLDLQKPVWLVFGNEAMDLDSQNCCLVMAYYLSRKFPQSSAFAVMNVRQNELHLRRDNIAMLDHIGVKPEELIYLNDFEGYGGLDSFLKESKSSVALVDHNDLSPRQSGLFSSVELVVDHHSDSGQWSHINSIIKPYASCSSLVGELLEKEDVSLLKEKPIRQLLYSAMVMDTNSLSSKATQPEEKKLFKTLVKLDEKYKVTGKERRKLESLLSEKRSETVGMSVLDLLQKDLKYSTDLNKRFLFCIASVKNKIRKLGLKEKKTTQKFLKDLVNLILSEEKSENFEELSAFFVLCVKKGFHKRLLCVVRKDKVENCVEMIEKELKKEKSYIGRVAKGRREELKYFREELLEEEFKNMFEIVSFELDSPISRKQVMPMLVQAFSHIS